jgi:hypothetical protein
VKASSAAVLAFLRTRGQDGATESEIQAATAIRSGAQRIHELKAAGHRIDKRMERSPIGAVYARWTLVERTRPEPTRGDQQALAL